MKNNKNLKILPSKVILSDGSVVKLDELNEKEKSKIRSCICKNINSQMSRYYSNKEVREPVVKFEHHA